MSCTEKQASERWCPFAREAQYAGEHTTAPPIAVNRHEAGYGFSNCIGSKCMAWHWEPRSALEIQNNTEREGYCGLAGGKGSL